MQGPASRSHMDEHAPTIARIGLSAREVVGHHAVDEPGERGKQRELRNLGHGVADPVGEKHKCAPLFHGAAPLLQHPAELTCDAALGLA